MGSARGTKDRGVSGRGLEVVAAKRQPAESSNGRQCLEEVPLIRDAAECV